MIPIPFSDARLFLPSAPPGKSFLPRSPYKLRKRPLISEDKRVSSKQIKKGTIKKLLKKPQVFVGVCKSVLTKVHKAKNEHPISQSNVDVDPAGDFSAPDEIGVDTSESDSQSGIEDVEVEIGDGNGGGGLVEVEVAAGDISTALSATSEVEVVTEEDAPVPAAVPDVPGIQPSYTEEGSISCIACVLGIGHGVPDGER